MPRFDDDDQPQSRSKLRPQSPPSPSRRSALKSAGLGVVGLAGLGVAGIGARAYQSGAFGDLNGGQAFDPWRHWDRIIANPPPLPPKPEPGQEQKEPPYDLSGALAAGVLAASPHNSQPWRFRVANNVVGLFADEQRALGVIDPFKRELNIGLGCTLENLLVGARAAGFSAIHNPFPEGPDDAEIARITYYRAGQSVSDDARVIGRRRTNRGPYQPGRAIERSVLDAFDSLVPSAKVSIGWIDPITEPGAALSNATLAATEAFVADREMLAASNAWFRHELAEIEQKRDGLTTMTGGTSHALLRTGLMLPGSMIGDPHDMWIQLTKTVQLPTAARFGLLLVQDPNDRAALIDAGRLWQRLHLKMTTLGIAAQPLNQLMEQADRERVLGRASAAAETLKTLVNRPGWTAIFAFRMGYSGYRAFMSPRRALDNVIVRA